VTTENPNGPRTKPKPRGLDRPSTTRIIKLMSVLHTKIYRRTGGRLGRNWRVGSAVRRPVPVCLLTTTGRRSGQPRTVPLVYLQDGANVVIVASKGGLPENPQWYGNVKANPDVHIEIGRRRGAYRARVAVSDERARLWPRLVEMYHDFASYQTWTDREIPVVICEPA
jgi:deazaflavin-dependent oxidoreductase (nitroreductase family)